MTGVLWVAAIATVLVGGVLASQLARKYLAKRRPYALWWTVSFVLAALAALTQLIGFAQGGFAAWDFRSYIVLSAAVPGFMGAGTIYLIWRRFGHWFLAAIWLFTLIAAVGAATTPLHTALLGNVLQASARVSNVAPGALVTLAYIVLGSLGGAALILGALYSYLRSHQAYNLLIALGGIVFVVADTSAGLGSGLLFFPGQILGMLLLYFGVAGSQEVQRSQQASRSA
jgi:hypothetical protein